MYYVRYGKECRGPYESWNKAYFAGLELFGFDEWRIIEKEEYSETET